MNIRIVIAAVLFSSILAPAQTNPRPKARPVQATGEQTQVLGRATSVTSIANGMAIRAGSALMRVVALDEGTIRVQLSPNGKLPPDNSFAVVKENVAAMKPDAPPRFSNKAAVVELSTAEGTVRIDKSSMRVTFLDKAGNVLLADDPNRPVHWRTSTLEAVTQALPSSFLDAKKAATKSVTGFRLAKLIREDEAYFGLGDKAGPLNHYGMAFHMWNTDWFGWQESSDPLYKTIPFFLALRNGVSYGLFLDNTFRTAFDFGKTSRESLMISADDGPIDYYFFFGPHPKKVIERYTALTGRTPLAPRWTLGFQQCRYSYYPEARVREIAATFKQKQIPVDAIYLDIDYQKGNAPFTVDSEKFPNFPGVISDLKNQGIKTILITDMHIKHEPGYAPYDSGVAGDHFIKKPDGTVYVAPVWPGPSVFPDFTRGTSTREWWGSLYKDFVSQGVKGFWNDMNEPAVFERRDKTAPLDVVHRVAMPDGTVRQTDHREIHNVYGFSNVRATYEGLRKLTPDERPFVLTRAAYAGAQRYSATWTGDNTSSWNHMRMSLPTLLNMGISGYANVGDDIGGFWGNPLPDVLTRWHQIGAFNPIFRNHTTKGSADQEPWVHGPEHEGIRKKYIELRYRLMPYFYTVAEENTRTGVPMMRAMFLEFPEAGANDEQFMYGKDILVAPAVWEMLPDIDVELPAGKWYDYWSNAELEGGKTVAVKSRIEEMPIYIRGGAIIPQMPLVQNMDEKPQGPLRLHVYVPDAKQSCSGDLYWDDGLTFAYKKDESGYVRLGFTCTADNKGLVLRTTEHGTYQPWWTDVQVVVHGASGAGQVSAGTTAVQAAFDAAQKTTTFTIPATALQQEVRVTY
jgi:alpha-glucosidase